MKYNKLVLLHIDEKRILDGPKFTKSDLDCLGKIVASDSVEYLGARKLINHGSRDNGIGLFRMCKLYNNGIRFLNAKGLKCEPECWGEYLSSEDVWLWNCDVSAGNSRARQEVKKEKSDRKMSPEQQDEVLGLLRRQGVNAQYRSGDFVLFDNNASGALSLKEGTRSIGFYGSHYMIMRKWAKAQLRDYIGQHSDVFGEWNLRIDDSQPKGSKAKWFTLKRDNCSWYDQREDVVAVAVKLFRWLQQQGVLDANFNVEKFEAMKD